MGEDRTEKVDFILNWLRSLLRVSKTKIHWLFYVFFRSENIEMSDEFVEYSYWNIPYSISQNR